MNKAIRIFFFLSAFLVPVLIPLLAPLPAAAQSDLLVLENKGSQIRTYTVGTDIDMQTVYNQWFQGTVTDLRRDSVYVNGLGFYYKEIADIRIGHTNFSNTILAEGMMAAGGGIYVLGAVNGLIRGDEPKDWYTGTGIVTGAALLVVGYLLTRTRSRIYRLGKKYKLQYLVLNPDKKGPGASPVNPLPIAPSGPQP